jgi:hypothetical protein
VETHQIAQKIGVKDEDTKNALDIGRHKLVGDVDPSNPYTHLGQRT